MTAPPEPAEGASIPPATPAGTPPRPLARRVPLAYLTLFCLLYAVQGVVFAYFANFNQGYMGAAGVSDEAIGFIGFVVLLPFAFKFVFGPLSDRIRLLGLGHRSPYIVLGLTIQAVGLVGLTRIDPGSSTTAFAAVALMAVVGLALYDTCTDGLVIDITPPGDRERVQGMLIFSRFATAAVATLGFGAWLQATGTGPGRGEGVLWACAGLTLVPLAVALVLREPDRSADAERFRWAALKVLIRPRALVLIAFGTFYAVVAWGVEINLPIHYDRLDYGPGAIGRFGSARTLGRALGGLLLPLGASRLGRRGTLRVAVLGLAVTEASQALIAADSPWGAGLLSFLFGVANGWTEALFYVLAMEASDPRMAASTFALFMAVSNLSVMGSWLFIRTVAAFGDRFAPAFVAAALVTCLALFAVRPLARLKAIAITIDDPSAEPTGTEAA
ncbi:MFS transporter [Tautonia sociabilis]|uniref:MFS transporter n=1 Tax=Tautonia sociabilis TaxID=2080755 RepID=A0A432MN08_9BACT|nr:MFS transporter [Tautonia sociabilis]RUL88834.1 MFS transporter [Tautonia sociabilis]